MQLRVGEANVELLDLTQKNPSDDNSGSHTSIMIQYLGHCTILQGHVVYTIIVRAVL